MSRVADFEPLYASACEALPELRRLRVNRRRQLVRGAKQRIEMHLQRGLRDPDAIAELVRRDYEPELGSAIAVAILAALVQYLVKKLLERWFDGRRDFEAA